MASTHDLLRIIRQAADRLDALDPTHNAELVAAAHGTTRGEALAALRRAGDEAVAIATAITTLRLVAAWLDEEPMRPISGAPLVEPAPIVDQALRLHTFDERSVR